MRQDSATHIRPKTARQQKYAVIKTALDPFFVALHELAGLAFVAGKLKQYDKHPNCSPLNLVCQVLSWLAATAKRTVRDKQGCQTSQLATQKEVSF